ncbi:MAG: hypothetical protein ACKVG5_11150 [Acidimicrobiales bacterium]
MTEFPGKPVPGKSAVAGAIKSGARHCGWCRRVLPAQTGRGRPRRFCSQRCRQWDWVSRQRANELDLSENELVIARDELDRLHDDLYTMACAVEDTERDMAAGGTRTVRELTEMLDWLMDAARPLRDREMPAPDTPR